MRDENQKPVRISVIYLSPIHAEFEGKLREFMAENEYEFYASGCTVGADPASRDISFELSGAVEGLINNIGTSQSKSD